MTKKIPAWLFKHEMMGLADTFGRAHGISVVFKGDQPGTDGKQIILPDFDETKPLTNSTIRFFRGVFDHECGHLRESDMPLIIDKYEKWPANGKTGLPHLHNSIEDVWMEPRVQRNYIGSRKNLQEVALQINEKELEYWSSGEADAAATNVGTLSSAIRIAGRRSYASNEHADAIYDKHNDKVKAWAEKAVEELQKSENSADNIRIAKALYKLLEEDPELSQDPESFDKDRQQALADQVEDGEYNEETEEQKIVAGAPDGSIGKIFEVDGDAGSSTAGDVLDDMMPAGGHKRLTGKHTGSYSILTTEYDEVVTRKRSSTVRDFKEFSSGSTHDAYERRKKEISSHTSTIKTKLRRGILAQQKRDWEYGLESGKLNTRKLVAATLGSTGVYKRRTDREDFDTAILLLVDQSGSMTSKDRIGVAKDCTISLAEALEGTSVSYGVAGFTAVSHKETTYGFATSGASYHRKDANIILYHKPFEDNLRNCRTAIGNMIAYSNNADRDAIVWALHELSKREETRKILVVLSDGYPEHRSDASTEELERQAKKVVDEASKMGVEVVGIGIESSTVKNIYKDYIVVRSLQELAEKALNKFIKLLLKNRGVQ
jgi:cobalamin biosynthesis protein CobT